MMNKIRDLFNKLKREKNRLGDPVSETKETEDKTSEIPLEALEEDKTSEINLSVEKEKKPRPEFLTASFWKTHFDTAVSRVKHTRLKDMQVPKSENENADEKKKKNFSFESLKIAFVEALQKLQKKDSQTGSGSRQKTISDHLKGILDTANRTPINRAFILLFIVLSFYTVGKITALLISNSIEAPKIAKKTIQLDYSRELTPLQINQMRQAKLFKTESSDTDLVKKPVIANNQKCESASKASRLPIKLVNTIVLQDSVKSIASVQIRSERLPQEFREGDKIDDIAQIDKIERLNIILKNLKDGSCEYIANNLFDDKRQNPIAVLTPKESKKFTTKTKKIDGIKNDGNNFTVSKDFMKDKMKDISSILTQARGIQITNPDGSISFKVVEVDPGGIFAYLGIQDNDVITQINGQPISDLNQVMSLFGKITNVDQLSLTIKRNGEEVPQDYKFQ